MNLPPTLKTKAFWQAASLVVAVVVAAVWPESALTAAKVEAVVFALLQLLGVSPEIQARGLK